MRLYLCANDLRVCILWDNRENGYHKINDYHNCNPVLKGKGVISTGLDLVKAPIMHMVK